MGVLYANYYYGSTLVQKTVGRFDFHQPASDVCIADESKRVDTLGRFPLPVEVIPMAAAQLVRRLAALGGDAAVRLKDGVPLVGDNGQHILDVRGLAIADPLGFESEVNQWPGVVTVGVFAHQRAQVCLLGTPTGVRPLRFDCLPTRRC